MKPQRMQRKRTRGWRMPKNTIYVGRPSKWGNCFEWRDELYDYCECGATIIGALPVLEARRIAVEKYKMFLKRRWRFVGREAPTFEEIKKELRGKNLCCWCPMDQPCHADVLLEIANEVCTIT